MAPDPEQRGVLILDGSVEEIRTLQETMKSALPKARVLAAMNPALAEFYMDTYDISIVFMDTHIAGTPEKSAGLAERLADMNQTLNVIFIVDDASDVLAAAKARPSGFLVRPLKREDVTEEVTHLKFPEVAESAHRHSPVMTAHCFGRFEVFGTDGVPLTFQRQSEKEILAYLIDRMGEGVTKDEISRVLWQDGKMREKRRNYIRVLISALFSTLHSCGADRAFIRMRDYYAVRPEYIKCDYYDYLAGNQDAGNPYTGEYMQQYAWAKKTCRIKAQTPDKILAM